MADDRRTEHVQRRRAQRSVEAVVVERVFVVPGLGSLLLDSVAKRELLTVQAVVMVLVVAVLVINFVVDLLYLLIDPRLRTGAR